MQCAKTKCIQAFSLLETLLSSVLGAIICSAALQSLFCILQTQAKVQHKFDLKYAKLIAQHYICHDLNDHVISIASCVARVESCDHLLPTSINNLIKNKHILAKSTVLRINSLDHNVLYYVRKSVLTRANSPTIYALYRDDVVHNAQALIENISAFTITIMPLTKNSYNINTKLLLMHTSELNIQCTLNLP